MHARLTQAEGSFLLPLSRHPDADRIFETRAAAHAAHEAALMAGVRRVAGRIADLLLAWPRRQRLLAELRAMSDRDLADIGLSRGDFDRVLALPRQPPHPVPAAGRAAGRGAALPA